jgi:hypothetical protein
MTSFTISNATDFIFTRCAPELLSFAANQNANFAWVGLASKLISARDIFLAAKNVVSTGVAGGVTLYCTGQLTTQTAMRAATIAVLASGVIGYYSYSNLQESTELFAAFGDMWNAQYPQINLTYIQELALRIKDQC